MHKKFELRPPLGANSHLIYFWTIMVTMKYKLVLFVIVIVVAAIVLVSYFAKRNFAICSFVGGRLEIISKECQCASQPCVATVCSHENKCVWGK